MTPLHVAAERGFVKIVDYLIDKGADIDLQEKNGVIRPVARIFRRGVTYIHVPAHVCMHKACKCRVVWGHALPGNFSN